MLFVAVFSGNRDLLDLIAGGSDENRHQRTDQIKDTIGEIGPCGDTQNSGLGHTAGGPRDQDGGHGHGILGGAAQQSALEASLFIHLLEHLTVQDDGDELIRCAEVQ